MPFSDPLTADTVLIRAAIQSPDYVAGVSGWIIRIDGTAEFNGISARGTIQSPNYVAGVSGWIIRSDGTAEFNDIVARGDLTAQALKTGTTVPAQRRIDINSDPSFAGSPRNTIFFLQDGDDDTHKGSDAGEIQASGSGSRWLSFLSGGTYDSGMLLQSHETVPLNSYVQLGSSGHIYAQPGQDDSGGRFYLYDNPTALYWPVVSEAHLQMLGPSIQNAALTLTTTATDVPNCSITFTTNYPNAIAFVWAQFDFTVSTAIGATGVCVGQINVDGTDITNCFAIADANAVSRQGASLCRPNTLAAAGSHTIKSRARKTINAGAASCGVTQTAISILVFDLP